MPKVFFGSKYDQRNAVVNGLFDDLFGGRPESLIRRQRGTCLVGQSDSQSWEQLIA
ncbi:hypothetical protein [Pontimonas salivibrio]|uniref:hypothetical protein n=1 Tax=Pontimonas salivibrio TaxID=1159327 RepID=UPI00131A1333|nr:hypothetical protein [Pontimonas salivibrio]